MSVQHVRKWVRDLIRFSLALNAAKNMHFMKKKLRIKVVSPHSGENGLTAPLERYPREEKVEKLGKPHD